ncbi:MAG: ABC transporter ATP-binding protein [Oscillospiraceae bacterium]
MKNIFKYYKPYIGLILLTITCIFMQSLADLTLPATVARIIDVGVANKDVPYIVKLGGLMLIAVLAIAVFAIIVGYLSSKIAGKVAHSLRKKLFAKVTDFSSAEIDKFTTSSLITRTTNDITQIQNFTVMFLRVVVMAPCMCIGGIIMAYATNAKLTLYVLLAMPLVVVGIFLISSKAIPLFEKMQEKLDRINTVTRENLTGMRVVKAFIRTDYEIDRFKKANTDLTNTSIKVQRIMGTMMPLLMLIMNITAVFIMWTGGTSVSQGNIEVGALVSFVQYVMQIMMSLAMLSMIFVMLPRAIVSANRINDVLVTVSSIANGTKTVTDTKPEVEFKNVTFAYPGAEEPVLKNITFTAKSGQTTAFIGSTGSGKSTIINLIPRFYDVTGGEILLGGINIKDLELKNLRDNVGLVSQTGILFSGTIAQNLQFGKADATPEEMTTAVKTAQAYDFIMEKEKGFDEHIAQGGTNVSGGQKQRLSIARTLIKNAKVLIFDDSFSALDFKTDSMLRNALKDTTKDVAVLIVAQRVSTIMQADCIVCLADGEVCGVGTHKELLKSCETYREIAQSQLSKEELEQ